MTVIDVLLLVAVFAAGFVLSTVEPGGLHELSNEIDEKPTPNSAFCALDFDWPVMSGTVTAWPLLGEIVTVAPLAA